jgi:hypothetical protein
MNGHQLPGDRESLFAALNLQMDALERICLMLTAACELNDGPSITGHEAIALKAKHRDVLWGACVAALQVCRDTSPKVLSVLQPSRRSPEHRTP